MLDTPYFGKTSDDGRLRLRAPAGLYRLWVWHPRGLPGALPLERPARLLESNTTQLKLSLQLGPAPDLQPPLALGLPAVPSK